MENPSLALCFCVTTGYGRHLFEPQFPTCVIGLVLRACAFIGCYETSQCLVHSACSVNWSCSLTLPGVHFGWPLCGSTFPHSSPGKLLLSRQVPVQISLPLGSSPWFSSGSDYGIIHFISICPDRLGIPWWKE